MTHEMIRNASCMKTKGKAMVSRVVKPVVVVLVLLLFGVVARVVVAEELPKNGLGLGPLDGAHLSQAQLLLHIDTHAAPNHLLGDLDLQRRQLPLLLA